MSSDPRPTADSRLCILMFLQFFIWGVWYVPMWKYLTELGVPSAAIGTAYAATGLGAMSPRSSSA